MKKIIIAVAFAAISAGAFAMPHHHGGWCHRPPMHHWHHGYHGHYHGGFWGRGGCHFWPGFIGGVVGGAIVSSVYDPAPVVVSSPTIVQQPVVVQQPTVVQQPVSVQQPVAQTQNVWVEGRYVDQVQANGSVVRTWSPGHYETRTVVQ